MPAGSKSKVKRKATKKKISFAEQIEGFPVWQISITSIVRIVEPIAFTSLFPYVYFMVRDFHVAKTEAEVSKYVGYLASCFSFCQFLSSVQWGLTADRIGRKKVLMIGLSGSTVGMLLFGFARNYWMALGARCLMGLVNGNTGVLRTVIGENCKEKKHQALALSTMPLLFQTGSILGPTIGGLLTNRSDNDTVDRILNYMGFSNDDSGSYNVKGSIFYKMVFPVVAQTDYTSTRFESFVQKYPYALSNVVLAFAFATSITCCFLFLEETHYEYKNNRDYGLDLGDKIRSLLGFSPPQRPWNNIGLDLESGEYLIADSESSSLRESSPPQRYDATSHQNRHPTNQHEVDDDDDDSISEVQSIGPLSRRSSITLIRRYKSRESDVITKGKDSSDLKAFLDPKVLQVVSSQVSMSAHNTVYSEFFPVFLAKRTIRLGESSDLSSPVASVFPFKIVGGMGFDSVNVGKILAGTGISGMFIVAVVFPYIDRTFSPVKAFRFLSFMYCVVYFTLPFLVFTLPPNVPDLATTKAILYCFTFLRVIASGTTVPLIVLLLHRAAPDHKRAFINGAALSASALARFMGPLIWGNLMSLAEKWEKGWFTWWTLLLLSLMSFLQSFRLKDEEEDDDEEINLEVTEEEEEENEHL